MAAKRRKTIDEAAIGLDGPERRCAVTRVAGDSESLIRFAASPDGEVVPDLDRRLPGRGVWLTAHRDVVEKAVKTRAFHRGFRENVNASVDLADRIEKMLARRAVDTLALANKAGLVVTGFQKVDAALDKGHLAALTHGLEAAEDGRSKLDRKFRATRLAAGQKAEIVAVLTIEEISLAIGRPSVVHAGLLPGGLTERFLRAAERVSRYREPAAVPAHTSGGPDPGSASPVAGGGDGDEKALRQV